MILFPPSKINLGLNVVEKRADGFHEVETVMYPIPLNDILEIIPHQTFQFKQSGIAIPGDSNDNLCVRAFELMKERYNISPVYIHLIKKIPMGAGLGGGSSDAASVLLGINELFDIGCSDEELEALAAELGSDCAFFIKSKPQFARGRGEILSDIDVNLSGYYLKLIYPDIHISTAEAYSGVSLTGKKELADIISMNINKWKDHLVNSFEDGAFELYAELKEIKQNLYSEGAVYAAMSGSGSAIFGLFKEEPNTSGEENEWILKL